MKKWFLLSAALIPGLLLSAEEKKSSSEWKLVWSDEFNVPGRPDPTVWRGEKGFIRNQELQWYTDLPENVFVKDGCLHIVARKLERPKPNPNFKPDSKNWRENRKQYEITSTSLATGKRLSFRYGRLEMRAQLPVGAGVWPAFWLLGFKPPWPDAGEIDILEFYYGKKDGKRVPRIHTAVHWKGLEGKHRQKARGLDAKEWEGKFHLFAMEWDSERIRLFYNGSLVQEVLLKDCPNERDAFRKPLALLVNLAIGGTLGGEVDPAIFPAVYKIDYIRLYQKEGTGAILNINP